MAEVKDSPERGGDDRVFDGGRVPILAALVAVAGFIGLGLGLGIDPDRAWLSYLVAYVFVVTLSVGGLILLMVGYAANARWAAVTRRLTEITALALPALALLFIPIPFGAAHIYPWAASLAGRESHVVKAMVHRAPYFNMAFFIIRAAIYFAIWITASFLLRRWSVRRDRRDTSPAKIIAEHGGDAEAALQRERTLSSALIAGVGLAMTFAGFDWVMSLAPNWSSTMFGFYFFSGGFLGAIGLVTILAWAGLKSGQLTGAVTPNHFHILGRLMFAFTIFWAYIAFFQVMLIAEANMPDEISFYLSRMHGAWLGFLYVLVLGHFGLPFALLLKRSSKFRPQIMAAVGGWLLLMHLVDIYWLIIPSHYQGLWVYSWLDLCALAAVGGTSVAVVVWRQRGISLLAEHDPYLPEGLRYQSNL